MGSTIAGTRESYKQVHGKDHFNQVVENLKWFYNYRLEFFGSLPRRKMVSETSMEVR